MVEEDGAGRRREEEGGAGRSREEEGGAGRRRMEQGEGGWVSHDVTAVPHPSPLLRRPPGERGSEKG